MNNNKINKKLEKLTPQQERLMYQFRDDWIDFVLNSGGNKNNNNEAFIDTYNKIKYDIWWRYEKANLKNKKPVILIADSYLEEKLMINFVKLFFKYIGSEVIRDQVRSQVWAQVRDQVSDQVSSQVSDQVESQIWAQVRDQVRSQVWAQVRDQVSDQVWAQVWDQVRSQVWAQVSDQVWDQVRSQVWAQVSDQVRTQVSDQVESQIWAQVSDQVREQKLEFIEQGFGLGYEYWLSFYSYFEKIGGGIIKGKQKKEFDRYIRPYQVGKIWSIQYFENFVFICRLPKKVCRDSSNRLHSTTEAAVQWNDGYDYFGKRDLYFIHGVYFEKEEWSKIVNNEISVKELLKMENKEKQRAALSVYSIEKLLEEVDAKPFDIYKNPRSGDEIILYQIDGSKFGLNEELMYIKYKDPSTDRIYISGVPREIGNANEAMAWKFGLTVEEYENELLQET